MPIHVFLADDHAVVRQGLKALLERKGFEVVGEAGDGQEAIQLAKKLCPDVAVLDVAMPKLNGIDTARQITKVSPRTKIILLTMFADSRYVRESVRAGVKGYVLKSKSAEELVQAIRDVCNGEIYLSPPACSALVEAFLSDRNPTSEDLSGRERQVLQLVAEGKTSKEISTILGISINTADSHRTHIMKRLAIHDSAGLVRYAIRHGLIQP